MKFALLKNSLKERRFYSCYLAYGEDSYLINNVKSQFLNLIENCKELNISIFNTDSKKEEFISALNTLPFMNDIRLIIAPSSFSPLLSEYLLSPCPSTIILLISDGRAEIKSQKNIELIDCNRLDLGLIQSFINVKARENNCSITNEAVITLIEYCNRFMGRIETELLKLISYKDGSQITKSDIEACVKPDLEYKVFELTDCLAKKSNKAVEILEDMTRESGGATKIFGLIYSHFRRLYYAKLNERDLASLLNIKDFAASIAIKQSKSFTIEQLEEILNNLHKIDYFIKNSSGEGIMLQSFLLKTLGG